MTFLQLRAKSPRRGRQDTSEDGTIGSFLLWAVAVGALVWFGFVSIERSSSSAPSCGGDAMSPGDFCFSYGDAGQGARTRR